MKRVLCLACYFLAAAWNTSYGYDWDYSSCKFDLTPEAVMLERKYYEKWKVEPETYVRNLFDKIPISKPIVKSKSDPIARNGYAMYKIRLSWPSDSYLKDLDYGCVLAVPSKTSIRRPLLIAVPGHEEVDGEGLGGPPTRFFEDTRWGDRLAKSGHVVFAPANTFHAGLAGLAKEYDYSVLWAKIACLALDFLEKDLPRHEGLVVCGLAAGGLTSLVISIVRNDVRSGIFAGSFFSLEMTRREYRINNHPFCHDFRDFFTYTAAYALLAPRPVQIQMGRHDGLWPRTTPLPPSSFFSGTKRGGLCEETIGSYLMLEKIWKKYGSSIELRVHDHGHDFFDADSALYFLRKTLKQ